MTTHQMAEMMVGASVDAVKAEADLSGGAVLLSVQGLSRPATGPFDVALDHISLAARSGEVLGIAGIAGNGQDELMAALSGEWRGPSSGVIWAGTTDISRLGPDQRRRCDICFIPEERNGHAAVPEMSLSENALLTGFQDDHMTQVGFVRHDRLCDRSEQISQMFDVRRPHADPKAAALSGGNLQKFVVGREIIKRPRVLIVAQPTWGVDVGAAISSAGDYRVGSGRISRDRDLSGFRRDICHLKPDSVLSDGRLSDPQPAAEMTAQAVGLLMGGVQKPRPDRCIREGHEHDHLAAQTGGSGLSHFGGSAGIGSGDSADGWGDFCCSGLSTSGRVV